MARLYYLMFLLLCASLTQAHHEPTFVGGHFNDITSVAYSPDGQYIVTGCWDGSLYIYSNDSIPQYYLSFSDLSSTVTSLAFSRDSRKLLVGSFEGKIISYNFPHKDSTDQYIGVDTTFTFTNKPINKVYYGPGLRMIFAADEGNKFIAYDLVKRVHRDIKTEAPVKSFAVSIDRMNYFIAIEGSTSIYQYNIQGKQIRTFEGHGGQVTDLEVTLDRKYLVSSSVDKTVRIWNLATGKLHKSFLNHTWDIKAIAIDPYSKYIVSCGIDGLINIFDISTGTVLNTFNNTNGRCTDISLSPDLSHVIVGLQMDVIGEEGYGANVWETGLKRPSSGKVVPSAKQSKAVQEALKKKKANTTPAKKPTETDGEEEEDGKKGQTTIRKTDQVEITIEN